MLEFNSFFFSALICHASSELTQQMWFGVNYTARNTSCQICKYDTFARILRNRVIFCGGFVNSKILLLKKKQKRYKLHVSYVHRKFASLVAQAKRFNNMTPQAITADVETNPKQVPISINNRGITEKTR